MQDKAIAEAQAALGEFPEQFDAAYQAGLRSKLGLFTAQDGDPALAQDLLDAMAKNQADFTLTFRRLSDAALDAGEDRRGPRSYSPIPPPMTTWAVRWRQRTGERAADGRRATDRDAIGQSGLHSAQSSGRSGDRSRGQPRRLSRRSRNCWRCWQSRTRISRRSRYADRRAASAGAADVLRDVNR